MTAQTAAALRIAQRACHALCFIVFTAGSAWAATVPIYKCFDRNLSLIYTDVPCKDGERLDVRAGDADPAAVAWLERQSDALEQSADQRIADQQRRSAAVGEVTSPLEYEPVDQGGAYDNGPAYVDGYGFTSYPDMHRHRMRRRQPRLHHMRHFAPRPPHTAPRH